MFYNIYLYLQRTESSRPIEATIKAYRLYLEQCPVYEGEAPVLGLTRAWTLLRFIDCGIIEQTECCICGGSFVVTSEHSRSAFTCSLCSPPSRAIKKNKIANMPAEMHM